jgi:hypothetical protein
VRSEALEAAAPPLDAVEVVGVADVPQAASPRAAAAAMSTTEDRCGLTFIVSSVPDADLG